MAGKISRLPRIPFVPADAQLETEILGSAYSIRADQIQNLFLDKEKRRFRISQATDAALNGAQDGGMMTSQGGLWTHQSPGQEGYVWTSNGPGALPTWQASGTSEVDPEPATATRITSSAARITSSEVRITSGP